MCEKIIEPSTNKIYKKWKISFNQEAPHQDLSTVYWTSDYFRRFVSNSTIELHLQTWVCRKDSWSSGPEEVLTSLDVWWSIAQQKCGLCWDKTFVWRDGVKKIKNFQSNVISKSKCLVLIRGLDLDQCSVMMEFIQRSPVEVLKQHLQLSRTLYSPSVCASVNMTKSNHFMFHSNGGVRRADKFWLSCLQSWYIHDRENIVIKYVTTS